MKTDYFYSVVLLDLLPLALSLVRMHTVATLLLLFYFIPL